MKERITEHEISTVFQNVLKNNTFKPEQDTAAIFYDLDFLDERLTDLSRHFPKNSLHAVAMKANPLLSVLRRIQSLGFGSEVASLPELEMAKKAGFSPGQIVFDSPCKTREELELALRGDHYINADSLDELKRIDAILRKLPSKAGIGIRINPQVGTGSIRSTSVAGNISKFGVPIDSNHSNLLECFRKYPWLTGVHVHIGSQGMPVDLLTRGIKKVYDFAEQINSAQDVPAGTQRIRFIDIGGGLGISYHAGRKPTSLAEYRKALSEAIPGLFSEKYRIITEFGRYIHTNTAWAASRVEYVKREPGYNILMSHLGADFMLRECYNPQDWHHEISVLDSHGKLKKHSPAEKYFIAGPLCFAGDVIGHDLLLPRVEEGDYLIIHDVGGYTLSMWSRYNSRQVPSVLGYRQMSNFEVLKERESIRETLRFWE